MLSEIERAASRDRFMLQAISVCVCVACSSNGISNCIPIRTLIMSLTFLITKTNGTQKSKWEDLKHCGPQSAGDIRTLVTGFFLGSNLVLENLVMLIFLYGNPYRNKAAKSLLMCFFSSSVYVYSYKLSSPLFNKTRQTSSS